jgi:hypothetical protein
MKAGLDLVFSGVAHVDNGGGHDEVNAHNRVVLPLVAGRSWALDEAQGVAVGVGHRGDAGAAADVLGRTGKGSAGRLYLGQRGLEVCNLDIGHRCGVSLGMTLGVEADLKASHIEPDVVRLVGMGLDTEDGDVDGLGGIEVADGMDDGVDSIHALLTFAGRPM